LGRRGQLSPSDEAGGGGGGLAQGGKLPAARGAARCVPHEIEAAASFLEWACSRLASQLWCHVGSAAWARKVNGTATAATRKSERHGESSAGGEGERWPTVLPIGLLGDACRGDQVRDGDRFAPAAALQLRSPDQDEAHLGLKNVSIFLNFTEIRPIRTGTNSKFSAFWILNSKNLKNKK
jgi:hypothetical protein